MAQDIPSVQVVILNYRTATMALRAAETCLHEMKGRPGGIVLVDNDSQDGSFELMSQTAEDRGWTWGGRLRVVQSGRNGGFGAGNNYGMRFDLPSGQPPDYVYVLNSDAWPEPGAIAALVDFLEENPDAGIAGSRLTGIDGAAHVSSFRFPTIAGEFDYAAKLGVISRLLHRRVIPIHNTTQQMQVDWVAGASVLLRRRMLDQIGQFDESFFLYYEETDLMLRAARAGWTCHYVPASHAVHVGSVSTGMQEWRDVPIYWYDSRLLYFAKNHGRERAALMTLAVIVGGLIGKARGMLPGGDRYAASPRIGRTITHFWKFMRSGAVFRIPGAGTEHKET